MRKPCTCKQVHSKIGHIEQQFQSGHDWAIHTGQGIKEDIQTASMLLWKRDVNSTTSSKFGSDAKKPMHMSPRRALCKTNYLELDSSDKEKSDENAPLDGQDREEVAEPLANARSIIGALERGKSMKEDKDKTIKEKHEDSSFVQTTTMTQADFHDGDSLLSWASSLLPEVRAASYKVTGLRAPQNMVNRTPCMSNKDKRKRVKENSKKKKLQGLTQKWRHLLPCRMSKCYNMMPA